MQSHGFAIAASALFLVGGIGMIYVTWVNPSSRFQPVLCARWYPFGRPASKFGAVTQSLTLIALGFLIYLDAMNLTFTRIAFVPLAAGVLMSLIARIGDARDDEA